MLSARNALKMANANCKRRNTWNCCRLCRAIQSRHFGSNADRTRGPKSLSEMENPPKYLRSVRSASALTNATALPEFSFSWKWICGAKPSLRWRAKQEVTSVCFYSQLSKAQMADALAISRRCDENECKWSLVLWSLYCIPKSQLYSSSKSSSKSKWKSKCIPCRNVEIKTLFKIDTNILFLILNCEIVSKQIEEIYNIERKTKLY